MHKNLILGLAMVDFSLNSSSKILYDLLLVSWNIKEALVAAADFADQEVK